MSAAGWRFPRAERTDVQQNVVTLASGDPELVQARALQPQAVNLASIICQSARRKTLVEMRMRRNHTTLRLTAFIPCTLSFLQASLRQPSLSSTAVLFTDETAGCKAVPLQTDPANPCTADT